MTPRGWSSWKLETSPVAVARDLTLTLIVYIVLRSIRRRYFNGLYQIPGPFLASISRAWRIKEVYRGKMWLTEATLHRKYGSLVRTGPNEVLLSDPAALPSIYGAASKYRKTEFYRLFGFPDIWGVHVFSEIDHELHAKRVRHIASAYTMSTIVELEPLVDSCIGLFIKRITLHLADTKPMNMVTWFQWYAFDVISELTFSTRMGFLETETDVGNAMYATWFVNFYVTMVGQAFWYHWLLLGSPIVRKLMGGGHNTIHDIATKQIKDRKYRGRKHRDMLSRFLQEHEKHATEFTEEDVVRTCAMNVGGGSDTTAIALASTFFYLLKNPETYNRLRDEIDNLDRDGKLASPVKYTESLTMPYLQVVIKEAMRLHPPVAFVYPRYVPQGGAVLEGHFLPEGTSVGMNAYTVHRNKDIFGLDADKWRPERWLEDGAKQMDRYMFQFGMGAYTCLGRHISILEMNKVVVEIIRRFDIRLADPTFEMNLVNRWFFKPDDLPCFFSSRVKARH